MQKVISFCTLLHRPAAASYPRTVPVPRGRTASSREALHASGGKICDANDTKRVLRDTLRNILDKSLVKRPNYSQNC